MNYEDSKGEETRDGRSPGMRDLTHWIANFDDIPESGADMEFEADEDLRAFQGLMEDIRLDSIHRELEMLRSVTDGPDDDDEFDDEFDDEEGDEEMMNDLFPSHLYSDVMGPSIPIRLIDAMETACSDGDYDTAQELYTRLRLSFPRRTWPTEAFRVILDYLLTDPFPCRVFIREIIRDYKQAFPYEETPYLREARLEELLGNHEAEYEVLSEAVLRVPRAALCAGDLARMQLARGFFEEARETCEYGIIACCSGDHIPMSSNFYFMRTQAKEGILRRRFQSGESVSPDDVDQLMSEYKRLQEAYGENLGYGTESAIPVLLGGLRMLKADVMQQKAP